MRDLCELRASAVKIFSGKMNLFDAHCHLQDKRYGDQLALVVDRACAAGVIRMSCCGSEEQDWEAIRKIALEYKMVLPSFGLYPLNIPGRSEQWLEKLKSFLLSIPSGVGEIGLDNSIEGSNDREQEEVFVAQLRLARELQRPVTIHCRKAWGRLLEILKQEGGIKHGGIVHTYSGSPELVRPLEDLGVSISFSGAITRAGNKRGCKALQAVSRERLLLETDSPDILPVGAEGTCNEPANLPLVARAAALLLGERVETVAELTFNNANRLFSFKTG
jgi:TatD DNase family protein